MLRLAVIAMVCGVLAILAGLQAASSVLAKPNPELAARLMPFGNEALQRSISYRLRAGVTTEEQLAQAVEAAEPLAEKAFGRAPLGPEGHAVLIMNTRDPAKKAEMLRLASQINGRDRLLQGVRLEQEVADNDFDSAMATLDQMLRVNPEQRQLLFPILNDALKRREAVPAFARVLDGSSAWHDNFLMSAARLGIAPANLAVLRGQLNRRLPEFDRLLVAALVREGDLDTANGIYQSVNGKSSNVAGLGPLGWSVDLAPFDWRLGEEAGMRAQPIEDGDKLEIFVRGGKGGIVAERLVKPSTAPFNIVVKHRIVPADQLRDVRLQLRCRGASDPFLDERFSAGTNVFRVAALPAGCDYVMLGINARAWSGRSPLRGTIDSITIAK
ncbi:hypothetical protein AMC99_02618 [Altererythrobacter epoxidivorans]|uniref:Uncharacterized protein n=1 Tax=Altererythrobacter epoxidivorans TaxID=361183 RepID=A0A0M4LWW7_9SPHN|nr:hypothetical protein [Altererythrobacter epoxidivorans]ALE17891.1 hypothetical protein AMC99_02618 [Altererythrobacter epoxidivorans]